MKEDPVQKCRLVYTQNVQMFLSESFIIMLVLSVVKEDLKQRGRWSEHTKCANVSLWRLHSYDGSVSIFATHSFCNDLRMQPCWFALYQRFLEGHVWCLLLSGIAGLSFDSPFLSTRLFFLPSPLGLALSILSFSMVHSPILVSFFSRIFIFHRELGFIFWLLFMMSRHRLPQTQNDNTHGCVFVILKMSVFNKLEHQSTKKTECFDIP